MVVVQELIDEAVERTVFYLPKAVAAIIILIIGLWIIRVIGNGFGRRMEKQKLDESLSHFLVSLFKISFKVILLITVISMLGVQMTSFIAILGAAGLAIGLALQGSLGNFAGGVLILVFKPFKVGDFIEGEGQLGKVEKIKVFNTTLKTPDNKTVIIPNGPLSNGTIVNYSTEKQRRVDMVFGIGYGDDIKNSRDVINAVVKKDKRILKDPEPQIVVGELGDSSVNFKVRVWAKNEDYWGVYFDMHENIKIEFDKKGISIPFPQTDVHVHNN